MFAGFGKTLAMPTANCSEATGLSPAASSRVSSSRGAFRVAVSGSGKENIDFGSGGVASAVNLLACSIGSFPSGL